MDPGNKLGMMVFKHFIICLITAIGLTANCVGFIASFYMKIRFPTARLLLRLQFIIDAFGCIVAVAYWVILNLNKELTSGPLFTYIWTNFYVAAVFGILSSNNMMLLAVDRHWAVVGFRTYNRDSKCYPAGLLVSSVALMIFGTTPIVLVTYYQEHVDHIGLKKLFLLTKLNAALVLFIGLIVPTIVISVLQLRILLILRRIKSAATATNFSSTGGPGQSVVQTVDKSTIGITTGILVMLITFAVARTYHILQFSLSMFGDLQPEGGTNPQADIVYSYSITFCINPLALIFTSPAARAWLFTLVVLPVKTTLSQVFQRLQQN
ncbi:hypothetical protein FBUS_02298 [Fasciolopsis buskii]|uniref:G-protein coupled receptors family 1 profile domain-containing protein n=1 Tax=Fasciolopsis buskii TaxID=27845 RepID=A0A8E0VQN7_9TREM|nr:hypothetical protein FBUS_02298 [Fasciolopsis buski]